MGRAYGPAVSSSLQTRFTSSPQSVATVIGLLMVPALDIRANVMLLAAVFVLVTALVVERRRERTPVA